MCRRKQQNWKSFVSKDTVIEMEICECNQMAQLRLVEFLIYSLFQVMLKISCNGKQPLAIELYRVYWE